MELILKKIEIATLILHMAMIRKNIKRGFKINYGKQDGKELLKVYDGIKEKLVEKVDVIEDEDSEFILNFELSKEELNMLLSFLDFYLLKIQSEIGEHKLNEEDEEQINILKDIQDKCKGVNPLEVIY